MPGLTGFVPPETLSLEESESILRRMQTVLVCDDAFQATSLFCTRKICATSVHTHLRPGDWGYAVAGDFSVWIDGELYNRDEIVREHRLSATTDADLLLALFKNAIWQDVLKTIDGIYAAVVFDSKQEEIHLVSDRCGLRPLMWTQRGSLFAWASETKAFLAHPGFKPTLDLLSLETFLNIGYLSDNRTWMEGVERLSAATCLTYRVRDKSLARFRYWWWDQIPDLAAGYNRQGLIEELGHRFIKAVERRCHPAGYVGLTLSGGLDSRAILAAMPEQEPPIPVCTFGMKTSPDVRIAQKVTRLRKTHHQILDLTAQNWLYARVPGIWWSDGHLNLLHMHGIEHLDRLRAQFSVCLNGAAGDGIVGGGFLFEPGDFQTHLENVLNFRTNRHPAVFESLKTQFDRAGSAHAFYIDHRIRSFTLHGPRLGLFKGLEYRLPFLDNAFQELLYTVPLYLKKHNRLYKNMLIATFPTYYGKIPWQSAGLPITWPEWAEKISRIVKKIGNRLGSDTRNFTNYSRWIRQEPARPFIEKILTDSMAIYPNYIPTKHVHQTWETHLAGADNSEQLGRYLTLELYLQQLFQGKWRCTCNQES